MPETKHKCMICGKESELKGSICPRCQENIRREALGKQDDVRRQSDKELERQGVSPGQKPRS
jgi:hypothetical protein